MPDKSPDARSPESLIRELRPIIVALLGSSGLIVFTRTDVPERLRVAAEILFWISLSALIASIIAAVYPVVGEPQVRWCWNRLTDFRRRSAERRHFEAWIVRWREYSELLLSVLEHDPLGNARESQSHYDSFRDWLRAHQAYLSGDAVRHVRTFLARRFTTQTQSEEGLDQGFFRLYREVEFDLQVVELIQSCGDTTWGKFQHDPGVTIRAVWDGLSEYSVSLGWKPLDGLAAAKNAGETAESA